MKSPRSFRWALGSVALGIAAVAHGSADEWRVKVEAAPAPGAALSVFDVAADGAFRFEKGAAVLEGKQATCKTDVLHETPTDYLRELISTKDSKKDQP